MLKHTYKYFLFLLLILSGCKDSEVAPQQSLTLEEEQLLLGNTSGATAEESNYNNYLMMKPQFALSYSRDRDTPNWVSWHVTQDWLGTAPRQDNFRADPALPEGWYASQEFPAIEAAALTEGITLPQPTGQGQWRTTQPLS